jgi:hypothetical protein
VGGPFDFDRQQKRRRQGHQNLRENREKVPELAFNQIIGKRLLLQGGVMLPGQQ